MDVAKTDRELIEKAAALLDFDSSKRFRAARGPGGKAKGGKMGGKGGGHGGGGSCPRCQGEHPECRECPNAAASKEEGFD
eukprot:6485395-Alexandrium_andersonii.AAC.1